MILKDYINEHRPTIRQLELIRRIEACSKYSFTGQTKQEAFKFIKEYGSCIQSISDYPHISKYLQKVYQEYDIEDEYPQPNWYDEDDVRWDRL